MRISFFLQGGFMRRVTKSVAACAFVVAAAVLSAGGDAAGRQGKVGTATITSAVQKDKTFDPGGTATGIEFQGTAVLPNPPGGGNAFWRADVELEGGNPEYWDYTTWLQPWTVGGLQAWSLHAMAFTGPPDMYLTDWPEGYYTFRVKITCYQGNVSTSFYSGEYVAEVWYD